MGFNCVNTSFICWLSWVIGPVCMSIYVTHDLIEVYSSLDQTSSLHIFDDYVVISLVYGQRNTKKTVILLRNLWRIKGSNYEHSWVKFYEFSYCKQDSVKHFPCWSRQINDGFYLLLQIVSLFPSLRSKVSWCSLSLNIEWLLIQGSSITLTRRPPRRWMSRPKIKILLLTIWSFQTYLGSRSR